MEWIPFKIHCSKLWSVTKLFGDTRISMCVLMLAELDYIGLSLLPISCNTIIGILQSWETMVTCSELRSVFSRAWSLGKVIWRIGYYPSSRSPLSTLLKWSNGKARANTTGYSNVAGVGRMTQTAFGTPALDFALRFTPEVFSISGYRHKAVVFEIGVFLLLDGLPSMADEPHLPGSQT